MRTLRLLVSVRVLVLSLILVLLLLLLRLAGRGLTHDRTLLRLPLSASDQPQLTNIQQSWINGKSQGGFLDVDNILKDPRTTRDSVSLDTLIVTTTKPQTSPQSSE